MIINICGAGGTGKSSIVTRLADAYPEQYVRLITYTSRSIRPGEVPGVSYHFVESSTLEGEEYVLKRARGDIVYAVRKCDLSHPRHPVLLTTFPPRGVAKLEALGHDCIVFYLQLDETLRIQRMVARGDSQESVLKRVCGDRLEFDEVTVTSIFSNRTIHFIDADQSLEKMVSELDQKIRSLCKP